MAQKNRILTISSLFRKRKWQKPVHYPKLTITGKWLEEAGFNIGDKINLEIVNNKIIISNEY